MEISIYGARGSLPTPLTQDKYSDKVKRILELYKQSSIQNVDKFLQSIPFELSHTYGGNTPCLSIDEQSNDNFIVIDAGSGLRELGNKLVKRNNLTINIFLSHFHWDHIAGIPFFKPMYNPSNTIVFYSTNNNLVKNLHRQQVPHHFPISFKDFPAKVMYVILDTKSTFNLVGYKISTVQLKHPGGSVAYILKKDNKKVSYVSDAEFTPDNIKKKAMYYKACFESSDLLVMDSQYSLSEFFSKFDWGHTSSSMAVNLALEWRIKKLLLFHFDPDHDDDELKKIENEANLQKTQFNRRNLEVQLAVEGTTITI